MQNLSTNNDPIILDLHIEQIKTYEIFFQIKICVCLFACLLCLFIRFHQQSNQFNLHFNSHILIEFRSDFDQFGAMCD